MSGRARLDVPETLHPLMVRGLDRQASFRDDADRVDSAAHLAALAKAGALAGG